jgi:hypothetical protein
MKLKYVARHGRKRTAGATIIGAFLLVPFLATLALNFSSVEKALRDGTWMISAVLLAGMLICLYLYLRPTSYLRLNPETRIATFVDGKHQQDFTFAALGPIRIRTTIPPGNQRARHYCVESDAVPVIFYVDSLRDPAIKKARELCRFLGVQGAFVEGVHPGIGIDE